MTRDEFWNLIEGSKSAANQTEWLIQTLASLGKDEVVQYSRHFAEVLREAYRWDLWAAAWLLGEGGCSDDSFIDFRAWLISKGKNVFYEAIRNPDTLVEFVNDTPFYEAFNYVDDDAYKKLTGTKKLPDLGLPPARREPLGVRWETADLKNIAPLLWKEFSND